MGGDRIYLHSRRGDDEVVSAFALGSGKLLWSDSYRSPFHDPQGGIHGPYATPAVDGGILYAFGMNEVLSAYDVASGKLLWRKDWGTEYKVPHPLFGASASPLVTDGLSIVHVGGEGKGALVALDANYLFVVLESAELLVVKKGGDAWSPVARFNVADSAVYTYPALAGDRILIRDKDRLTLWSLGGWGVSLPEWKIGR